MGPLKPAIPGDGFATRLAAFYAALFVALGIQMPFLPVWLAARGLDADAIGTVLAAPLILRMVALPFVTGAADGWGALRGALIVATAVAAIGYGFLGFTTGFWPILVALALASAAFTSTFPLVDAYALKGLVQRGRSYGSVRLWGSGAFIAGSLGAGILLDSMDPENLIWIMTAASVAMVLLAAGLKPMAAAARLYVGGRSGRFLRSPAFLAVAGAAGLIQGSHALFYGFSTLDWARAGLDGRVIGTLWAIGVLAEIAVFALSGRLPPHFSPPVLMGIGAAGAVVRWGAMALDPPALLLAPLQCLHGLSFGATHLGAMSFLARATPDRLSATAQGYLTMSLGGTTAAMMALSGWLYAAYAGHAYGFMALVAFIGGALALAASRLGSGSVVEGPCEPR